MSMTYTETLTVTHCWCGIAVAVPENLYQHAQKSSKNEIYCPLGHVFVFRETWEEKFKREQRDHYATMDLLAQEEQAHARTQTKLRRTVKRIEAGVCPHCNRTFQNVARHMQSKHPECVEHEPAQLPHDRLDVRREMGSVRTAVLAYLDGAEHTYSEIREHASMTSNHTSVLLHRLLASGEVKRLRRGVYTKA